MPVRSSWLALLVAGTYFMENLDGTVIATAAPSMATSFGVLPVDLEIGISAYLLRDRAPSLGARGDRPRRRRVEPRAAGRRRRVVLAILAVRHLYRTSSPLLRLDALRVPTFAATIYGGSLFRMAISAVPFLLPLMFQVGFGIDPFRSGLLVLAVFAGNLVMKPATTPVLRRFGFRTILVGNGLIDVVLLLACTLLSPTLPVRSSSSAGSRARCSSPPSIPSPSPTCPRSR